MLEEKGFTRSGAPPPAIANGKGWKKAGRGLTAKYVKYAKGFAMVVVVRLA